MYKKYIALVVTGLLSCTMVFSQNEKKHELSVWGGGGLSALKYDTEIGDTEKGMGGAFGVGYNYYFNKRWSIGTGLELSFYNAKTTISSLSDSYETNDGEYDFTFYTAITKYKEKQNAIFLNIPIVAQFQMPVIGKNEFYVSGGFKIGMPVSKKMTVTDAYLNNYGYYPEWDNPIKDDPYFMGFGAFRRQNAKGNLDLKMAYILTLETGLKWALSNTNSLYTGAYFDYGLNNIKKDSNRRLVEYNKENPENFIHNSVLSSQYIDDKAETIAISKEVKPIAIGIKVRLAFGL